MASYFLARDVDDEQYRFTATVFQTDRVATAAETVIA